MPHAVMQRKCQQVKGVQLCPAPPRTGKAIQRPPHARLVISNCRLAQSTQGEGTARRCLGSDILLPGDVQAGPRKERHQPAAVRLRHPWASQHLQVPHCSVGQQRGHAGRRHGAEVHQLHSPEAPDLAVCSKDGRGTAGRTESRRPSFVKAAGWRYRVWGPPKTLRLSQRFEHDDLAYQLASLCCSCGQLQHAPSNGRCPGQGHDSHLWRL